MGAAHAEQLPELVAVLDALGDGPQLEHLGESGTWSATVEAHPQVERIHLFLAGPGGLALLLGHRWNRVRPTLVYEHLAVGRGYVAAFIVDA